MNDTKQHNYIKVHGIAINYDREHWGLILFFAQDKHVHLSYGIQMNKDNNDRTCMK